MKLHTGMFYAYQDQYGWTVSTVTGAPFEAFWAVHDGPRTFNTRAEAQTFIEQVIEAEEHIAEAA